MLLLRLFGKKEINPLTTAATTSTVYPKEPLSFEKWKQHVNFGGCYSTHKPVEEDGDFLINHKKNVIREAQHQTA